MARTPKTRRDSGSTVHHAHILADFEKRFWISLIATVPILGLSPMIQEFLVFKGTLRFTGDGYILFVLSSFVFFFGGYPFLKGIVAELKVLRPGIGSAL